ncbi:MAG: Fe-S cluster domain-containing protein [Bacteroidaceae bacterium]|nr:Fe-S cluster domain-containing protein [Bacteroidaceae bacterium]
MNVILIAVIVLGLIGLVSALILFFAAKRFAVHEDERIGKVQEVLPGANCGGCGYPGCAGFAGACVKAADAGSLEGYLCPVGGQPVMEQVAGILGMTAVASAPKVAVVRCNGTCENRPRIAEFDGAVSCKVQNMLGSGETACAYGCLGCGDCVEACQFGAIRINPETGIAEVDEEKCTACGACAKACPRNIIEIRLKGPKNRRVVVLCNNKDKGAQTRKACAVGCIACQKCVKVCKFEAITVEGNLSYIDAEKCKLCRKCEEECPQHTIVAFNFPPRKPKPAAEDSSAAPKTAPKAEAPKAEAPKVEATKAEATKTEAPKATAIVEPAKEETKA